MTSAWLIVSSSYYATCTSSILSYRGARWFWRRLRRYPRRFVPITSWQSAETLSKIKTQLYKLVRFKSTNRSKKSKRVRLQTHGQTQERLQIIRLQDYHRCLIYCSHRASRLVERGQEVKGILERAPLIECKIRGLVKRRLKGWA